MDKLTLLFDGSCVLCNKEVQHYLKLDTENLIVPVDISKSEFDASVYGLKFSDVDLHMHAIDNQGRIYIGVNSFIAIWRRIPKYQFLIPIFENRYLRPMIDIGYDVFAKHIRKRLPKKKCQDNRGRCELKNGSK